MLLFLSYQLDQYHTAVCARLKHALINLQANKTISQYLNITQYHSAVCVLVLEYTIPRSPL